MLSLGRGETVLVVESEREDTEAAVLKGHTGGVLSAIRAHSR
jgi:hypothetical protein